MVRGISSTTHRRGTADRREGVTRAPSLGRLLILTGCTVLWAWFPATGHAAPEGDATIRIDSVTLQANEFGSAQAFCPDGTRVVGGGVTGTGSTPSRLVVSGPLDETGLTSNLTNGDVGRSWYAYIQNAQAQNTFVSTAICSAGSDATLQVDPFTLAPFSSGDGQAFCPSGARVIGGGLTSTGGTGSSGGTALQVSGPLDETGLTSNLSDGDVGRSFYAYLANGGPQNTFVSTAICSAGSDATIRTDSFTVPANSSGDGQAFCPTDTRVVGGGVTSIGSATNSEVRVSGPLDESGLTSNLTDGDLARSWYANVYSAGVQNTYVSTAICAPSSTGSDTDPPETEITKGAPNKLDKHKFKFKFTSSEPDSTFECKVDSKPFKPCTSPRKVKHLDEGKHKFKVVATDAAGNTDPSAAKDKFKVVG